MLKTNLPIVSKFMGYNKNQVNKYLEELRKFQDERISSMIESIGKYSHERYALVLELNVLQEEKSEDIESFELLEFALKRAEKFVDLIEGIAVEEISGIVEDLKQRFIAHENHLAEVENEIKIARMEADLSLKDVFISINERDTVELIEFALKKSQKFVDLFDGITVEEIGGIVKNSKMKLFAYENHLVEGENEIEKVRMEADLNLKDIFTSINERDTAGKPVDIILPFESKSEDNIPGIGGSMTDSSLINTNEDITLKMWEPEAIVVNELTITKTGTDDSAGFFESNKTVSTDSSGVNGLIKKKTIDEPNITMTTSVNNGKNATAENDVRSVFSFLNSEGHYTAAGIDETDGSYWGAGFDSGLESGIPVEEADISPANSEGGDNFAGVDVENSGEQAIKQENVLNEFFLTVTKVSTIDSEPLYEERNDSFTEEFVHEKQNTSFAGEQAQEEQNISDSNEPVRENQYDILVAESRQEEQNVSFTGATVHENQNVTFTGQKVLPARQAETQKTSPAVAQEINKVRNRYIVGKLAGEDLQDSGDRIIIGKNEVITPEVVELAEKEGKLPDLIVHMIFPGMEV